MRRGGHDHLLLRAHLPYWEGLIHVVERVRRMLGLDVDFAAADHLAGDPVVGPLLKERPGLRVPGAWGPFEAGVAAVVAQREDPAGTRALLGRLAREYGPAVPGLGAGLDRAFPAAEVVASAGGLPTAVGRFAAAVAGGTVRLDGGADLAELVASLTAIPGIGETAAHHLAMRLGERDAFPAGDLGPAAEAWRPWRSLAATHLLAAGR